MQASYSDKRVPQSTLKLMHRVYKYVLPSVKQELTQLRQLAERIPSEELRTQALNSIRDKKFHCQGGSVYAVANMAYLPILIPLIVAMQTISDYLDNLCDRSTSLDPDDFRMLHQSMLDAATPGASLQNYYMHRDDSDDGGYLQHLVRTCQQQIAKLPAYPIVQEQVLELIGLYSDLQVYKHICKESREVKLLEWWRKHQDSYPHLQWNEFAAAAGSTLAMFLLLLAASDEHLTPAEAEQLKISYFPHVCCLHILLDYLIDQEEDKLGGDLNFCNYYENESQMIERLHFIVGRAREDVKQLPASRFHSLIIEGLLALYLSDPKVREQSEVRQISKQLMKNSTLSRIFFFINSCWIRIRRL